MSQSAFAIAKYRLKTEMTRTARLCRLMCGKALPYRSKITSVFSTALRLCLEAVERQCIKYGPEGQRPSAHQTAKPQEFEPLARPSRQTWPTYHAYSARS